MNLATLVPLLPPLVVVGPLLTAGFLLAASHLLPHRFADVIALGVALAVTAACLAMASRAQAQPLVYWFGGWAPRDGFPIGIGFVVDPIGAHVAALIGLLFAASITFAWGYFDEVHAHFHVLLLLFMAGMIGFCLTHDLFNLFVWFEIMSVAAFALTGYQLRSSALEGALNFTIINTLGSYLFLAGIGLIYSQLGALDFSALGLGVAAHPHETVIIASFILLMTALLIKAAQVPFHFWLADAHAVAPSPVSVIFSGAMVSMGLFGIARLTWSVFAASPAVCQVIERFFIALGATSAVLGALMAISQRHLKRLLAFSTMSHMGILLMALSLLDRTALSGMVSYVLGHGLAKGALFIIAGILLALCGGIDEHQLRGAGRRLWPAGIVMGVAALLIAGLPWGLMGRGAEMLHSAAAAHGKPWMPVVILTAGALTGGAILRATGRIFLGLGRVPGIEADAPTEADGEKADRPLWLMLLPAGVLIAIALLLPYEPGEVYADTASFIHPDHGMILGSGADARTLDASALLPPGSLLYSWLSVGGALLIAASSLSRIPRLGVLTPAFRVLQSLHCAHVGDYAAWQCVGLASLVLAFTFL